MDNNIICTTCRHARKSHGAVVTCTAMGACAPGLAALYGRCRRYQNKQTKLGDENK